jgi:hypothetical protein
MTPNDAARLCFVISMVLAIAAAIPVTANWRLLHIGLFLAGLGGMLVVGA